MVQVLQLYRVCSQAGGDLVTCAQQSPELLQAVLKAGVVFITFITGGLQKLRPLLRFQWSFPRHGRGSKSSVQERNYPRLPYKFCMEPSMVNLFMIWPWCAQLIHSSDYLFALWTWLRPCCFSWMLSKVCTNQAACGSRLLY